MMKAAICVIVLGSVGCTPRMHKAYQITVATIASAAETCAVVQTRTALRDGDSGRETNWLIGDDPGDITLAGTWVFNTSLLAGGLMFKERHRDDAQVVAYSKDVGLTIAAAAFIFMAVNDHEMAQLVSAPSRCGL